MPMLKAERISCSGPKLSDAQTRNFEAIKHMGRNKALKAVARKRMKVVYAIMRDAVPYEPRR